VVVSPDGGRALVAFSHGRDGPHTSVIWNLASGKVDKGPAFDQSSGSRLRWSPGAGKSIWIGTDRDQGAGLYPGVGNDKRRTTWLGDADDRPRDAVFLPDGKRILTGTSGRGVMRLLNAADGRELRASRDVSGHLGEVLSLSITRDGSRLLSCGKDHTARLWDLQGNRPLRSIPLQAYDNPVALMTPDGTFAIASVEGLSVITLPEGKPRQVLVKDRNATPLAVSPDGSGVLARTPFGTTLWEIPSGREVWSQKQLGGAAAFSADQRRIYNGVEYKSIVSVIDAGSGVVKASFGQGGPASTFALAPREDFLILGGSDGVGRYDIPAGRFAWTIASRHYVRQVAISPDGRWFVVTGSLHWGGDKEDTMKRFPSRVELRSTADGAVVDALDLDSAALTAFSAAFTPDGRALLVGTEDGPILRFAVTP
jgi:WD40 repeat protein